MSEQLAIEPPPSANKEPHSADSDEVLVGNIVTPDHPGLRKAVDAAPNSSGVADITSETPQVDRPEQLTTIDVGIDSNGKRQTYARTYTQDEQGQYQETARHKATIITPSGPTSSGSYEHAEPST